MPWQFKKSPKLSRERKSSASYLRCAERVSIAANIAEGFKKRGTKDKSNFYNIAQGSLEELRYYLILSKDLTYLHTNEELMEDVDTVGRMLHGLIISIKSQ